MKVLGLAVDAAEFDDEIIRDNPVAEGLLGDVGPIPGKVHRRQVAPFEARPLGLCQAACIRFNSIGFDQLAQNITLACGHVGRGRSNLARVTALAPGRRQNVEQFAIAELSSLSVFGSEVGLQSAG